MPPAAATESLADRLPPAIPAIKQPSPAMIPDAFAKDAIIAWFRGEFAAANAIIDALCNHIAHLEGGVEGRGSDYEAAFAAIHRRRLNWIPILQMQKFYPIADVANELKAVVENKKAREMKEIEAAGDEAEVEDSGESEITDLGCQEVQPVSESDDICTNHEECEARRFQIKITKGFIAKEPMKGHMVNVAKGLKLCHDIFTGVELSKLTDCVNQLRVAGQNGELSGETFIMYNQQVKGGTKRKLIQLGAPIFGPLKENATSQCKKNNIEPIPETLQSVIKHLIQWHIISENRKPNSCIINFFDEGEYSQPFLKPPHLDQQISTLLLSESEMALGRALVCDNDGNYKGSLMLSLKEGTLLVMRGNSAGMARHVMCPSPNKRISVTFFRVQEDTNENRSSAMSPLSRAMTLCQQGVPNAYTGPNGAHNSYEHMDVIPKLGFLRTPMVMLTPVRPIILSPKRIACDGTGVFLPCNVGSRRPARHLPPRAQKGRFLALPPPVEAQKAVATSDG